jgi:hypothetical protein
VSQTNGEFGGLLCIRPRNEAVCDASENQSRRNRHANSCPQEELLYLRCNLCGASGRAACKVQDCMSSATTVPVEQVSGSVSGRTNTMDPGWDRLCGARSDRGMHDNEVRRGRLTESHFRCCCPSVSAPGRSPVSSAPLPWPSPLPGRCLSSASLPFGSDAPGTEDAVP